MGRTPSGDGGGSNWFGDDDPWIVGRLDDTFVNAAPVAEKSADERIAELHEAARSRQLLEQLAAEEDELVHDQLVRRRRRLVRSVAAVVLVALVVGAGLRFGGPSAWGPSDPTLALGDVPRNRQWDATAVPTPTNGAAAPLGKPAAAPADGGTFGFVAMQLDGVTPVAYDPCRPIHYVVNERTAPPGATAMLEDALDEVSRRSGLRFVDDGETSEAPSDERAAFQPARYGDRWAPVLIAWTDAGHVRALAGDVVGNAGSVQLRRSPTGGTSITDRDTRVYVTGSLNLDGPQLTETLARDDGTTLVRAVILHELGHLVGLDHVKDANELMYPTAGGRTTFGPGDLHGLAEIGQGACIAGI